MIRFGANFGVIRPAWLLVQAGRGGGGAKGGQGGAGAEGSGAGSTGGRDAASDRGGQDPNTPRGSKESTAAANQAYAEKSGKPVAQVSAEREGYASELADAADVGNTAPENVANFVARVFGFTEEAAPSFEAYSAQPNPSPHASWGVDPIGLALGLGGFLNPIVNLVGLAYNGLKMTGLVEGPRISLDGGTSQPQGQAAAVDDGTGRPGMAQGYDTGKSRPGFGTPNPVRATAPTPIDPPVEDPAPPASSEQLVDSGMQQISGRNRYRLPTPAPIL